MLVSNVRSVIVKLIKDWNILFLLFFIYNFCLDSRANVLVSTFVSKDFFTLKLNSFFVLFASILTLVILLKFFFSKNYTFNSEYLSLNYRFIYFSSTLVVLFFNYLLSYVSFFFNFFYNGVSNNFFLISFREVFNSLISFTWFPVFRRLSYFGLFRANRQKWVEINNENINRLKY